MWLYFVRIEFYCERLKTLWTSLVGSDPTTGIEFNSFNLHLFVTDMKNRQKSLCHISTDFGHTGFQIKHGVKSRVHQFYITWTISICWLQGALLFHFFVIFFQNFPLAMLKTMTYSYETATQWPDIHVYCLFQV